MACFNQSGVATMGSSFSLLLQPWIQGVAQAIAEHVEAEDSRRIAPAEVHYRLGIAYLQTRQFTRAWQHARQAEALGAPVAELIAALRRVAVEPQ